MLSSFRNLTLRRVLVMLLGIVLLSIGVALFDFSRMGNDPSTSVVIALGDQTGLGLSRMMLLCNSVYFIVEILLARGIIGLGTFVNWTCIGPIAEVLLARMYRVPWLCEGDVSFPVHRDDADMGKACLCKRWQSLPCCRRFLPTRRLRLWQGTACRHRPRGTAA